LVELLLLLKAILFKAVGLFLLANLFLLLVALSSFLLFGLRSFSLGLRCNLFLDDNLLLSLRLCLLGALILFIRLNVLDNVVKILAIELALVILWFWRSLIDVWLMLVALVAEVAGRHCVRRLHLTDICD